MRRCCRRCPSRGWRSDHAQQRAVCVIVDDIHAGERQQAVGVCDVEHVTAAANEAAPWNEVIIARQPKKTKGKFEHFVFHENAKSSAA